MNKLLMLNYVFSVGDLRANLMKSSIKLQDRCLIFRNSPLHCFNCGQSIHRQKPVFPNAAHKERKT